MNTEQTTTNNFLQKTGVRAIILLTASIVLGLTGNALQQNPLPIFDSKGPGAVPQQTDRLTIKQFQSSFFPNNQPAPDLILGKLLIIDARERTDYEKEHIPQAIWMPPAQIMQLWGQAADRILAAEQVVVYCDSADCFRADSLKEKLEELGVKGITVLQGGWSKYQKTGLPKTAGANP